MMSTPLRKARDAAGRRERRGGPSPKAREPLSTMASLPCEKFGLGVGVKRTRFVRRRDSAIYGGISPGGSGRPVESTHSVGASPPKMDLKCRRASAENEPDSRRVRSSRNEAWE